MAQLALRVLAGPSVIGIGWQRLAASDPRTQRQRDLFVDAPVPEPPEDERMADLFQDMAAD